MQIYARCALFFWAVIILSSFQWCTIAATLHLIQMSMSCFSSWKLDYTNTIPWWSWKYFKVEIYGCINLFIHTTSNGLGDSKAVKGFGGGRRRHGVLLGDNLQLHKGHMMYSQLMIFILRGVGSSSPYLIPKGKSLTRTWSTIYFEAFIYS